MSCSWIDDARFYHIYPLGLCGAPPRNDFSAAPVPRLDQLYDWLDHIAALNLNALYLGPIFESTAHGYDTADYFHIDRRLGTRETFKALAQAMKARGLRLVLDGVFHHVGRDFWAFRDVLANGQHSAYVDWFHNLDFNSRSPYGDPFNYEGWDGHQSLVKLNLHNPAVRQHLFDAVRQWIDDYDIDGLRLDAADKLDFEFMRLLARHCRAIKPDFWLMGEVVHGDYTRWANADLLDATTNYECYKGLYSSHVDQNYFEIAYSLNRLFGAEGIYRHLLLYNFADNHDVNRVASNLKNAAHLYPLYLLLFTMPGVPSIYYGSEWGLTGARTPHSDKALRPALHLNGQPPQTDLAPTIGRLAALRRDLPPLQRGGYAQLHVAHQQFAFSRTFGSQTVVVAVNAADQPVDLRLNLPRYGWVEDRLNGERLCIDSAHTPVKLYPNWGRVLVIPESP